MAKARRNTSRPKAKSQKKKKKTPKPTRTDDTSDTSPTNDPATLDLNVTKSPHTPTQSNATLPANEKPPEQDSLAAEQTFVDNLPSQKHKSDTNPKSSFKTVLLETSDKEISDGTNQSTFLLHKSIYDSGQLKQQEEDFPDDLTSCANNSPSLHNRIRMRMMIKIPSKKQGISDDDAPFEAIKKINEMLKALTNKLPVKVGPWKYNSLSKIKPMQSEFYTCLPEDVDIVEAYVFDYSRFLRAGKSGYFRLQLFFGDDTSASEIKSVAAQFKKPKERFFEEAYSDAISPVHIGTLTGSVAAMATSIDFYEVFKMKFKLSELGLYFAIPRILESVEWNKNRSSIHIEINRTDLHKRKIMESFFNKSTRSLDSAFFGTPMFLAPAFDYQADDEVLLNLNNHTRKQTSLGKSIRSITISGIQVCNWADKTNKLTFLRELMSIESLHEKKVIKSKKVTSFKGRLFYAILPDSKSKTITFYCSKANYMEGRSVARGLPLFIRDHFKLDPEFFCSSTALADALNGNWDFEKREFQTLEEKVEHDRLDDLENEMNAEQEIFISKEHQMAMALDDDIISVETRLTKGDAPPPPIANSTDDGPDKDATNDDLSELTGSTRESKANRYAANAVKEVALQYADTIALKDADLDEKEDRIARLEAELKRMHTAQIEDSDEDISFDEETFEKVSVNLDSPSRLNSSVSGPNHQKPEKRRSKFGGESPVSHSSKRRRKEEIEGDTPITNNVSRAILTRSAKGAASSEEDTSL